MRIKSIKKLEKARVINLTVHKNHTFITENGVVTHNCDYLTPAAMAGMRGFIDEFSTNCSFIFTGNYKDKIIPQLLERMEVYQYDEFSKQELAKQIVERLMFVLNHEGKEFDPKDLIQIVNTYYPSIRSMVGALQKYTVSGSLVIPEGELDNLDKFDKIISLIKTKKYNDMIESVNAISAPNAFYGWLYKNSRKYFEKENLPKSVMILAKYQEMDSRAIDKNLNLCACCTELMMQCQVV